MDLRLFDNLIKSFFDKIDIIMRTGPFLEPERGSMKMAGPCHGF